MQISIRPLSVLSLQKPRFSSSSPVSPEEEQRRTARLFEVFETGQLDQWDAAIADYHYAQSQRSTSSHQTLRTLIFVDLIPAIQDQTFKADHFDFTKGLKARYEADAPAVLMKLMIIADSLVNEMRQPLDAFEQSQRDFLNAALRGDCIA